MSTEAEVQRYLYATGEEVVVRLTGVAAYDVECGHPATNCRDWTIAAIVGRSSRGGRAAYAISFEHHGGLCVTVVEESEIDGTA